MNAEPNDKTGAADDRREEACSVQRMVRRIVAGRAYTVMDSLMTAFERGECEFRGEAGELLVPKLFGRAGDGFHAVFNSPNTEISHADKTVAQRKDSL